ncbi:MAG: hypothetical protein COS94_04600 [Candidatus Hydrogenedentes bacterium CG07_land_8_20_14_0_80_42_17]|nr:MAG: hypothetical protein AUJ18_06310 [Candidatus Hydrogenedentes bacterium CG1_02_42_14]PIU47961.1 MAG: hypothetical protein COS94_04600 [Candidatus Hydrogenedentes bacterium CG07_land_8_20_14_0_80_42_17]
MLRYFLMALPGSGDAFIAEAMRAEILPLFIVRMDSNDFSEVNIPLVSRDELTSALIKESEIDSVIVAGWEEKIPSWIYSSTRRGGWNIHPSLLPNYRGHNPYFYAIRDGLKETGITVHSLSEELDCGDILLQRRIAISKSDTIGSLWKRLNQLGAEAGIETIRLLSEGEIKTFCQPKGKYPTAPKVKSSDFILSSEMSCEEANRLVRACNPFYGAYYEINGKKIKIFEVDTLACNQKRKNPILRFRDGELAATIIEDEEYGLMSGEKYISKLRDNLVQEKS